jgi:hypothetical protein
MSDREALVQAVLDRILTVGQRFSFHGREHEFPRLRDLVEYHNELRAAESRASAFPAVAVRLPLSRG